MPPHLPTAGNDNLQLVWLQAGSCGGCTMSTLDSAGVGIEDALSPFGIEIAYHPALSTQCGTEARADLAAWRTGARPLHILCVEGSVLDAGFHMSVTKADGEREPFRDLIADLAQHAQYVVAVGSCASFGGIPAGGMNPSGAQGMQFAEDIPGGLLGVEFRSGAGMPVINISGCAPHSGWVVETLAAIAQTGFGETDLDGHARPRFFADHLAHHGCSRNEYYEFKASAESMAQSGCLMEHLGCLATQAAGDCNQRQWSGGNGCTDAGYACIACTQPGFESKHGSYLATEKVAGIPLGLPRDMPKAWFVALAALSKSATPERVRENARRETPDISPWPRERGK